MKIEHINPHIRFAMTFRYPITGVPHVAYDAHMYYIIKGKGTLTASGKTCEFSRSSVIFIPAGIPYLFLSDEEVYCISLNFDFAKSNSEAESPIDPVTEEKFNRESIFESITFEDHEVLNSAAVFDSSETCKERFDRIEAEFISKKPLYREVASAELKGIIAELLRMRRSGNAADGKINRVLAYIREHFSENIQNRDIADIFGYHPYHLNRLMKSALGTTLHQYLISYRIEMAKRFLAGTDLTAFEISKKCGYNNFSNFSSDFKKRTGYTPLAFRDISGR